MKHFHLSVIILALFILPAFYARAQYVSPFKYENGTFRSKSNDEIRREEVRYKPNPARTNNSTSSSESAGSASTPFNYAEYRKSEKERKALEAKRDSLAEAAKAKQKRDLEDYLYKGIDYAATRHRIDTLFRQYDFEAVDSLTLKYYEPFSNEQYHTKYDNAPQEAYINRLFARVISQFFLGKLDSAWENTKHVQQATELSWITDNYIKNQRFVPQHYGKR